MSDCCKTPQTTPEESIEKICPVCKADGKPVDTLTVKALLRENALARLRPITHRFCAAPACDVVYFDVSGQTFSTPDIRVDVWQKIPFGHRMVCYCFGENEADLRREIEAAGGSEAVSRVRAHIEAGRCACEVRNPAGVCCLGDVTRAVKQVVASAEAKVAEAEG